VLRPLTVFDIYDRDREPADSIAIATHALSAAADAFTQAAQHLSDAQAAIAHQGVNEDSTGNLRRRPSGPAEERFATRHAVTKKSRSDGVSRIRYVGMLARSPYASTTQR
jgi:hypothetical protein